MATTPSNIPWDYIPLSKLMASVREDLHMYDEANMIDDDRVIKIVAQCNEKLGERIYQSKQCKLIVENGKALIPDDLWKIENMFGLTTINPYYLDTGIKGATQVIHTEYPYPKILSGDVIIPIKCQKDKCCSNYYTSEVCKEDILAEYTTAFPITLSEGINRNMCTDYCPSTKWHGKYSADVQNGRFNFSFKEGEVYLSYLGNMEDEDGELIIPFHPMLNQYYEYTVKAKIAEDIYVNSEADIEKKMYMFKEEVSKAYYDAFNYVQTAKANQWSNMRKKAQMEYFNKWYKAFQ